MAKTLHALIISGPWIEMEFLKLLKYPVVRGVCAGYNAHYRVMITAALSLVIEMGSGPVDALWLPCSTKGGEIPWSTFGRPYVLCIQVCSCPHISYRTRAAPLGNQVKTAISDRFSLLSLIL